MRPSFKSLCLLVMLIACAPAQAAFHIVMTSDAGDYIGLGQAYDLSDANGTLSSTLGSSSVQLTYDGTVGQIHLWFKAPSGMPLTPGMYAGAMRYSFAGLLAPGMDVFGMGRGCNTQTGFFIDYYRVSWDRE